MEMTGIYSQDKTEDAIIRTFKESEKINQNLEKILKEIKGLRKDLKVKEKSRLTPANTAEEIKPFLEQYEKILGDVFPKIIPKVFPNLIGSSSISCGSSGTDNRANPDAGELKKYLAAYVKEMTKSEVLENMPGNLRDVYLRLVQHIIKPNDPIFSSSDEDEVKPDPREPED